MNWDWEKLKKKQENKEGGMVPPKVVMSWSKNLKS